MKTALTRPRSPEPHSPPETPDTRSGGSELSTAPVSTPESLEPASFDFHHHAERLAQRLHTELSLAASIKENATTFSLDKLPGILKAEAAVETSGFVPWHIEILTTVAKQQNAFLLFRPFNQDCTDLLSEGCVAKPAEIKAKSADWGPMQGYVPYDPRLSKTRQAVDEADNPNKILLDEHPDRYTQQPLKISLERVGYLANKGVIDHPPGSAQNDTAPVYTCEGMSFKIQPGPEGNYSVHHHPPGEREFQPVMVICDQHGQPCTADYDTFAVYPALSNYRAQYHRHLDSRAQTSAHSRWHAAIEAMRHGLGWGQRSRSAISTERESAAHRSARDAINALLRDAGGAGDIITHGPEQENLRHFEQDDNILVITPQGEVYCTTNWQQTQAVAHAVKQLGYLTYDNPAYNQSPDETFHYLGREHTTPAHKAAPVWNPQQAWETLTAQP